MFTEVDVFIANNTLIDPKIYQHWLDGFSAQEAAKAVQENEYHILGNVHKELIISYVLDQFRTYQMIEKLLHIPTQFTEQWTFQLTPATQRILIEKYYEFKDNVIRELLGRKLSTRNRKDLEDVSEKTDIRIKSCRRQFDNIKRVYKMVEDMDGDLCQNIQTHFMLPSELAKKYASIVYIAYNRFETNKKKLQYLQFSDFLHCSSEMMTNWSCTNTDCKYEEALMEMDREFLQDLRDLKVLLERDLMEDHRMLVLRMIKPKLTERKYSDLDSIFKTVTRNIINIANGLNHSKEMRDIFIDIVEKVIEPFKSIRFSQSEVSSFLKYYQESPQFIDYFKAHKDQLKVWDRFIGIFSSCINKMYR